jgi:hypothetical protein
MLGVSRYQYMLRWKVGRLKRRFSRPTALSFLISNALFKRIFRAYLLALPALRSPDLELVQAGSSGHERMAAGKLVTQVYINGLN